MTYSGHVRNGVIVLDDAATLPDGAAVHVVLVEKASQAGGESLEGSLAEMLLRHAGTIVGMPPDASIAHDKYLYGDLQQ